MTSESARVPILIVDDNASKRLALQAILGPLGHTVVEAGSGREALRRVMERDFGVILMDVVMPDMDGFETAALIRQRAQSLMTPIIFITAHGKDEIVKPDLYAEGAVDFIFAPVPPQELRAKVSAFARLYAQAAELAERALEVQASADQLRLLTDAAPVGIFQTDSRNRYVYTNPRWSELTGVAAADAMGAAWHTIFAPGERAAIAAELSEARASDAEVSHRFQVEHSGSDKRTLLLTSRAIPSTDDGAAGWVGTLADVSAEVGVEAAMSAARDEATQASRMKSDFLANMSHEIRTPMNGVIGMADLLLETDLDPRQDDYARAVRDSGEALLTIIDGILDFSKIEAGKLQIEEIQFDLRSTIENVVDLLAGSAQTKGIALMEAIAPDVPARVSGDPGRVRQILLNLIGNAIKFTQSGEVVVRVTTGEVSGGSQLIRFAISDTGDGMAEETVGLVFQPFSQADTSTSRKYGGTGLGLSISRQLVQLMGGECGASSELGVGSDFWFTIAVAVGSAQPAHDGASSETGLANVAVLVADSSATHRDILSGYLAQCGTSVACVGSGEAAATALRAAAARGNPFDVVLMARSPALVRDPALAPDPALGTPLVMMVDLGHEGSPHDGVHPGPCTFLSRPVHLGSLRRSLRSALGLGEPDETRDPPAEPAARPPAAPSQIRLLLAEDNLINQKVAVAMLSGAGYRVDTAANGVEAVEAVRHRSYDAILMDCQMPDLNGYEATAAIRAHEGAGPRTPIIALTAGARAEDRTRCMAAGMDGYLAKPASKDALLELVAKHATRRPRADDFPGDTSDVLDEQVVGGLETLGADRAASLVTLYLDQAAGQVAELADAVDRGDTASVGLVAHKLKGGSSTVGAATVSRIASELEAAASSGDLTAADSLLSRLGSGLDQTRTAFQGRPGR